MKVLISDFDGTLYINEDDVQKNAKKIEDFRKSGNIFIISTARNYSAIKKACLKYNIDVDYFFCDIGATILNNEGKVLHSEYIKEFQREKIEEILERYSGEIVIDRYGTNDRQAKGEKGIVEYKIKGNITDLSKLKQIIDIEIKDVRTQVTEDSRFIIHTSTKEKIIETFIKNTNIEKCSIYTVGDELDDLEMLKEYNGYRMEYCNEIVKDTISNKVASVSELIDNII